MKHMIFLNKVRSIQMNPQGQIFVYYANSQGWTTIEPEDEPVFMGGATPSITETDALLTKWRSEVEAESS